MENKREYIVLEIGQCGVQLGAQFWNLITSEHNIGLDGRINKEFEIEDASNTFFKRSDSGKYVPRNIFFDLEPSVNDELLSGEFKNLFHPKLTISGKEDASNNFSRGYYTIGREYIDDVLNKIKNITEESDGFEGFIMMNSFGGGTGSGFTSLLLEKLLIEYKKKSKLLFSVFPSHIYSTSVVEPYNSLFSTVKTLDNLDCNFLFDNQALYNISKRNLFIERPKYKTLNNLIAKCLSSTTSSVRFSGDLNVDIKEIETNLVPYPKLKYLTCSYSPIMSQQNVFEDLSVNSITKSAFENQMITYESQKGKNIAFAFLFRGEITPSETVQAVKYLKEYNDINLVNWCPTGFKIGLCKKKPEISKDDDSFKNDKAVCIIKNSTGISQRFKKNNKNVNQMIKKRAFLHWFIGEGMEEIEIEEAIQNSLSLEEDYTKV